MSFLRKHLLAAAAGTLLCSAQPVLAEDRAVIIGINIYQYQKDSNLRAARGDAIKFRNFVRDDLGLRDDQITLLLDQDATRKAVIDALARDLKFNTKPGDRLIFYFSGHGAQISDREGDEDDGKDELIFMADIGKPNEPGILLDDDLRFIFEYFKDRRILVVVDSCYSGTISRGGESGTDELVRTMSVSPDEIHLSPPRPEQGPEAEVSRSPTIVPGQAHMDVWSAVSQSQVAIENRTGGIFTGLFLKGLSQGEADRNRNGRVSNAELLAYVRSGSLAYCRQSKLCRDKNGGQLTPEFSGRIERIAAFMSAPVETAPAPGTSGIAPGANPVPETVPAPVPPTVPVVETQPVPVPVPETVPVSGQEVSTAPVPDDGVAQSTPPSTTPDTQSAPVSEAAAETESVPPAAPETVQVTPDSAPVTPAPEKEEAQAQLPNDVPPTVPVQTETPVETQMVETQPVETLPVVNAEPDTAGVQVAEGTAPEPQPQNPTDEATGPDAPATGSAPVVTEPPHSSGSGGEESQVASPQPTTQTNPATNDIDVVVGGPQPPQELPVEPVLTCDALQRSDGTELLGDLFLPDNSAALRLSIDRGDWLRLGDRVNFDVAADRDGQIVLFDLNPDCELFQIFPSILSPRGAEIVDGWHRVSIPSALSVNGQPMEIEVTEPVGRGHLVAVLVEDDITQITDELPDWVNLDPIPDGLNRLTDLATTLNMSLNDPNGRRPSRWHATIVPYTITR